MNNLTKTNDLAPALTLMFFAPLVAEILPGATRFSAIFVFPIEVCVWGGGALLIRYAVRRRQLGWVSMLLLALALAVAEECLIQQTSLAPMVIRLKGETYARVWGINYVYMLWALIYEAIFVVIVPIHLVELLYPSRRERPWISKAGIWVIIPLFLIGSVLAWFSWTRIARPKVFHLPIYTPPALQIILAVIIIFFLIFAALKKASSTSQKPMTSPAPTSHPIAPPPPILLIITAAIWSILLYGLVLLGFGIAPQFPPLIAVIIGLLLAIAGLLTIPRWKSHQRWKSLHIFALVLGILLGSMAISFIGFIGSAGPDLYFKIIMDGIAVILLAIWAFKRVRTWQHLQT